MNQIDLSILGIQFQSETHIFRDDGFVEDVHEHARKINVEFGDDPDEYTLSQLQFNKELPHVGGLTRVRHLSSPKPIIIFYNHSDSSLKEIFIRGHEETHALQEMQSISLLQERLTDFKLNVNVGDYLDRELIADIGGLYAVIKHGFSPFLIMSFLDKENKDKILELYLEFLGSKNFV